MSYNDWIIDMQAAARELLIATVAAASETPRPAFAWEGERFTPTADPYIAESFRPDRQTMSSVGGAGVGTVEHRATVALVLNYPPGEGTVPARTMAARLTAAFSPGVVLQRNGRAAAVVGLDIRPAFQDADRYTLPVNIALLGHVNL